MPLATAAPTTPSHLAFVHHSIMPSNYCESALPGSCVSPLRKIAIAAAGFALLGVLAYSELVLDWRTPHADQKIKFALTSSAGFLMADYNRLQAEMKQKYGERVSVSVPVTEHPKNRNGVAEVSLDGNVIETHSLRKLSDVYGLFVVAPDDPEPIRFPFRLEPDQYLANLDRSLVKKLTDHFKQAPRAWFGFGDGDWTIRSLLIRKVRSWSRDRWKHTASPRRHLVRYYLEGQAA